MNLPDPQETDRSANQHRRPDQSPALLIAGIALLVMVGLWIVLVASGAVGVEMVGNMPEHSTRVLSTREAAPLSGTGSSRWTLTLFHTNDTLGYVDPCS